MLGQGFSDVEMAGDVLGVVLCGRPLIGLLHLFIQVQRMKNGDRNITASQVLRLGITRHQTFHELHVFRRETFILVDQVDQVFLAIGVGIVGPDNRFPIKAEDFLFQLFASITHAASQISRLLGSLLIHPVSFKFFIVGELGEIRHSVQKNLAMQMVDFMLEDHR